MKRTQRQYLSDLMEVMEAAQSFVTSRAVTDLEDDLKLRYAVERAFTIIGEAARKVDPELKARYPEVPWASMAGMRDHVVHGYWTVSREVVWKAIHRDFPAVLPHLRRILLELPAEEDLLNDTRA